jgi:hypothetical protein
MMQNKLSTLIQTGLNKTAGKLDYARIHDNPKLTAIPKKKVVRYPTKEERRVIIRAIVDNQMHLQTSDATMVATHKLAACLDEAYPHHLTYQRHIKAVSVTEEHLKQAFGALAWGELPRGHKNSFLRELDEYKTTNYKEVDAIAVLLKHQQDIMAEWNDKQLTTIARIQEDLQIGAMETESLYHTPVKFFKRKGLHVATFTVYDTAPVPFKSKMQLSDVDRGRLENRLIKYIGTATLEQSKP